MHGADTSIHAAAIFILIFVAMSIGVLGLLAQKGGWATLAKTYRAEGHEEGERFRFVSCSMGRGWLKSVTYRNCLFVTLNNRGIRLSILFPFRFRSPPLFLSWKDVETVSDKRSRLEHYAVITLKDQWPRVTLYGRAAHAVLQFHEAYSKGALPPEVTPIAS